MIQLFHVSKTFARCVALRDITLRIDKGECVLLTGPSGAGKTTLLKLIFGTEVPDEGQILVQNRNIARLRATDVPYLRRTMGFVLQDFKLLGHKTVEENVALPLIIQGVSRIDLRRKVADALKAVGLERKRGSPTIGLSAGEQQRVCIARAIVNNPVILLADEPTGNLDMDLTLEIIDLFKTIHARGTTVLLATHNPYIVERMKSRVLELQGGHLVRDSGEQG
ncbi:MAG: ATP-binding cassette domain-containing protein [Nitrospirae bacterium]|nr:MAG: ATP-binding cassette domain-containing protein [Nitrospirota bacterium]